jgi:hypothetical protein
MPRPTADAVAFVWHRRGAAGIRIQWTVARPSPAATRTAGAPLVEPNLFRGGDRLRFGTCQATRLLGSIPGPRRVASGPHDVMGNGQQDLPPGSAAERPCDLVGHALAGRDRTLDIARVLGRRLGTGPVEMADWLVVDREAPVPRATFGQRGIAAAGVLVEVPGLLVPAGGMEDLASKSGGEWRQKFGPTLGGCQPVEVAGFRTRDKDTQVTRAVGRGGVEGCCTGRCRAG